MKNKVFSKVIATMLVLTLTCANLIILGLYAQEVYAASHELEGQGTYTNIESVEFDAFFLGDNNKKIHTQTANIDSDTLALKLYIKVTSGYLKDAKIIVSNSNVELEGVAENLELIQSIDVNNQTINLNQINKGTEAILEVNVKLKNDTKFDLSYFDCQSDITLTGTHVTEKGKELGINSTKKVEVKLIGDGNVVVNQQISKYVPFETSQEKGIFVQSIVKTNVENNILPVEQTKLIIDVPTIDGKAPSKVFANAQSTKATNGGNSEGFGKDNYTYNKDTKKLEITVNNTPDDNNKVSFEKQVQDEYVINYIYIEDIQDVQSGLGELKLNQTVESEIKVYNKDTNISSISKEEHLLTQSNGQIVDTLIGSTTPVLNKGFIYNKGQCETEYSTYWITDIGYSDILDKIILSQDTDKFTLKDGTSIDTSNYAKYKSTKISKANFIKLLGEEGYINIYDNNGNQIASINKDTPVDEQGKFYINYEMDINNIKIETSKPIEQGRLQIEHIKAVKESTDYTKKQIENIEGLQLNVKTMSMKQEEKVSETSKDAKLGMGEPSTKIDAQISNTNLSTVVKNENVDIRVILKNNAVDCDLYKNPIVEIELPSYIESIDINNIEVLFDNQLAVKNKEVITKEEGNKVIRVTLEGEQTAYNLNEVTGGTSIVLNTNIKVSQLAPTKKEMVRVYVTNQKATSYENEVNGKAYVEKEVEFVAPVGLVTLNSMENYNNDASQAVSISGNENTGKLELQAGEKTARVRLTMINNYKNSLKNIKILGRTPFEGNKSITDSSDLGSTFTAEMISQISAVTGISGDKITVYYSENGEATRQIDKAENNWTKMPEDFSKVKSYLIELNDFEMKTGDTLEFSYDVKIPENLGYDEGAYSTYIVYFDNVSDVQTMRDMQAAPRVGAKTSAGANLKVDLKASVEDGVQVQEGQIIKYTVTVRNEGTQDAEYVNIRGYVPYGTNYVEINNNGIYEPNTVKQYVEKTVLKLKSGGSYSIEYYVQIKDLKNIDYLIDENDEKIKEYNQLIEQYVDDEEKAEEYAREKRKYIKDTFPQGIQAYASVYTTGMEDRIRSDYAKNKVIKGYLGLQVYTNSIQFKENETVTYIATINNINLEEKTGVVVKMPLPEGTKYKEDSMSGNYDSKTNMVTWNLGTLKGKESKQIRIMLDTDKLEEGQYYKELVAKLSATCEQTDKETISNENKTPITKARLQISQTADISEPNISVGDIITYDIKVTNNGSRLAEFVKVTDYLPEGMQYLDGIYKYRGNEVSVGVDEQGPIVELYSLSKDETVEIKIRAKVKQVEKGTKLESTAKVKADEIDEISSNTITHIVDGAGKPGGGNGQEENGDLGYKISGTVWLDANGNGQKDDEERKLGNIKVILLSANGEILKTQTTSNNGTYSFTGLKNSEYMVAFVYDDKLYTVTTYQKEEVDESKNSDAMKMNFQVDGQEQTGALTNKITINNSNLYNIDLGLIETSKFDLSLNKVVTQITVQNSKGTKVYNYDDTSLAKVDINANYINGTTVLIKYKITVKNEGSVPGYAKKIVDYLPTDVKFNSELNTDWYQADNGNIYSNSLANTVINPGESKEITLIVTKSMTEENVGMTKNTAEIYEAYNDLGVEDTDSTPANKSQSEDDFGTANAIITINTGAAVVYVTITLIMLALLGVGAYIINKRVLRKI